MTILYIALLFVLCFALIKSADQVVLAVHRLSKNSTSVAFIISALFLAIATSLPELFVGITSGLSGISSLSFGNVVGANIANITLVAGIAAFVAGGVNIHQKFVRNEILIAGIAGILPFILVFIDGELGRVDGLILIFAYLAYALSFFKERFFHIAENLKEPDFFYKLFRKLNHVDVNKSKEIGRLFLGIIALLFSANILVSVAKSLAASIGIPIFLVGLIIVSIGTTLPELVFSMRSLKEGEPTMFLGNLLGSIIINSTLITGVAVMLSPIKNFIFNEYLVAFTAFVVVFFLFWLFTRSKFRLDKREALILLALYITFAAIEFIF